MLWWILQQLKSKNAKTRLAAVEKLQQEESAEASEVLAGSLADEDPGVRKAVAAALGQTRDEKYVPLLLRRLNDSEPSVRQAVVEALAKTGHPSALEALPGLLQDPDADVTWQAAHALQMLGWQPASDSEKAAFFVALGELDQLGILGPPAIDALMGVVKSGPYHKRVRAVELLTRIGDARVLKPILECLQSEDPAVRGAAAASLSQIGDARAVEPLVAALRDSEKQVRLAVIISLSKLGDQRAAEPLVRLLKDPVVAIRAAVAEALGRLHDAKTAPALIAALEDPDGDVREHAAESLGQLGDEKALERLVIALKDEQSTVRQAAARSLRRIDPYWERSEAAHRALPVLETALRNKEYWVRYAAADVLARLGRLPTTESPEPSLVDGVRQMRDAAASILVSMLEDRDREFRLAASEALGRLNASQAVAPLVAHLADNDAVVRTAAARSLEALRWQPASAAERARQLVILGKWSEAAALGREAVDALVAVLQWGDLPSRRRAIETLVQIGDARAATALQMVAADPADPAWETATAALDALGSQVARDAGGANETPPEQAG